MDRSAWPWPRRIALVLAIIVSLAASSWLGAIAADEHDARRLAVGINLFPAVLAADQDIAAKRRGSEPLRVLLIHRDEGALVEELAATLRDKRAIRGIPLEVEIVAVDNLAAFEGARAAGLFVAQRLGDDITTILNFSRRHHLLSFSPFEGDVERGVVAGMAVSDRVMPYVNVDAISASGLRIKPFFLKIAERYERH
ncbi:MAG: YfiR family protein [Rhodocyclaceae bacterium]|nr:YfiR family protein [Rhodocyclaceae bacterium]